MSSSSTPSYPFSVRGKSCLVTGSSDEKCIGFESARVLLQAGASAVTLHGRHQDKVDAAVTTLKKEFGSAKIFGVTADCKKPETMPGLVEKAAQNMGGALDILVISVANGGREYMGLPVDDDASYRFMFDIHVCSTRQLIRAAEKYLLKVEGNSGSVVVVSSLAAAVPWPDTLPYNAAIAGKNLLIETLAFEYRKRFRINGVVPACIHTGALERMADYKKMPVAEYSALRGKSHPMERSGTPEEVAAAVLWLACPASSYTTGELLKVDGGLALSNWYNVPQLELKPEQGRLG